jgi:hypothetical protein
MQHASMLHLNKKGPRMSGAEREQRGVLIVPTPLWLTLL